MKNLKFTLPQPQTVLQLPLWIFAVSLGIGTLLLLMHFAFPESPSILIGVLYIAAAFVVNLITFSCLIVFAIVYRWLWQAILLRAALLLVNIPIVVLYIYIIINFSQPLL